MSNLAGALPLAGGTLTGPLILSADPLVALGACTKQYADALASGFDYKLPCYAATTAALTATYSNGASGVGATLVNAGALAAFSVDGVSPPLNSRVLVINQASTFQNGIYTLTTVGSGAVAWVLTRATDYDQAPAEIFPGNFVLVNNGTANAGSAWIQSATVTTIGTDPIVFSQFGGGDYAPIDAQYLTLSANASLTSERVLTTGSGTGLKQTDAGAGSTLTLAVDAVVNAKTSGYTADATDRGKVIRYTGGGGVTLALTAAATLADGWYTTLRNDSSGTITIDPNGAETINGAATLAVTAGNSVEIHTNGTLFYTLGTPFTAYYPGGATIPVSDGGTGVASFTAFAVVCGGTTSTGALQSIASVGTSGQVLTSNGAGALPTFQSNPAGAGALAFIASVTASASATVDFSNNLSSTYDHYMITIEGMLPATDAVSFAARVGTGGTPTYQTTNYVGQVLNSVTTFANGIASGTDRIDLLNGSASYKMSNTALITCCGQLLISNVNDSTNYKNVQGQLGYSSKNPGWAVSCPGGQWQGATVLTSIRFLMSSGNVASGVFKLYGIKNS